MGPSGRIPRSLSTSVEGTVKCPDPDQFQDPLTSGTELVTIADGPVGAAELAIGSNGARSATEQPTTKTSAVLDDIKNIALMVDPLVYDGRAWPLSGHAPWSTNLGTDAAVDGGFLDRDPQDVRRVRHRAPYFKTHRWRPNWLTSAVRIGDA
jgi:hypothetical protein